MFPRTDLTTLPDHLRWRCETVAPGTQVEGLLAGVSVPVRTHWNGKRTLPCLHDITSGELYCPCRTNPMSGTTTVYTPLITKDVERLVVPCSPLVGAKVMGFKPGMLISFARPKHRCAALRIGIPTESDQTQGWVKRLKNSCIHSIEEYLLHLWQIPALNKHFGVPFRPAVGSKILQPQKGGPSVDIPH